MCIFHKLWVLLMLAWEPPLENWFVGLGSICVGFFSFSNHVLNKSM